MKKFSKQLINIFCASFFLILIFFPWQVLAATCPEAHPGWTCQDPAARDGLRPTPCDTAISCPTDHKCCPPVAVQRAALTAYTEGQNKESAGDLPGACEAFQRAQSLLPSPTTEAKIARVCEAAPSSPAAEAVPEKIKLENPLGGSGAGEVTSPTRLIGNIIKTILTIVGALALAMFVYGGFTWLTSAGSPEKVKKGKDILIWAVIGLIVIFTSYTAVDFVLTALGV